MLVGRMEVRMLIWRRIGCPIALRVLARRLIIAGGHNYYGRDVLSPQLSVQRFQHDGCHRSGLTIWKRVVADENDDTKTKPVYEKFEIKLVINVSMIYQSDRVHPGSNRTSFSRHGC